MNIVARGANKEDRAPRAIETIRRLSGDLFGSAAERFRVGLGARVDDRVGRAVNTARYVGRQEHQLVLDLLGAQGLASGSFPRPARWPPVLPDLRGIRHRT